MGRLRGIRVDRLKDKLGTRKLPTAELDLEGTPAEPVLGTTDGVKNITPMLNVTRVWNGVSAIALMRRGLALARDYAPKRVVFGAPLAEKPLEAGARRFALTLGRCLELALLTRHARWALEESGDRAALAAATRLATSAIDLVTRAVARASSPPRRL